MGNCCKQEQEQEVSEQTDYNQNNNEDIFKTRPPCKYGYQCSCPCHRGGKCLFLSKSK